MTPVYTASSHGGIASMLGELVPEGGGDPIPLLKQDLVVGRRENCDIVLRFSNVSSNHCKLSLEDGYWFVTDLNSRNGTKVNGHRVNKRFVAPGARLTLAKHCYRMDYSPEELGAKGPQPQDDHQNLGEVLSRSLMDSAGLNRQQKHAAEGRIGRPARPK